MPSTYRIASGEKVSLIDGKQEGRQRLWVTEIDCQVVDPTLALVCWIFVGFHGPLTLHWVCRGPLCFVVVWSYREAIENDGTNVRGVNYADGFRRDCSSRTRRTSLTSDCITRASPRCAQRHA